MCMRGSFSNKSPVQYYGKVCIRTRRETTAAAPQALLIVTPQFVACLFMLCDVLYTVAKLQGGLQSKDLDLVTVAVMVESTLSQTPRD